MTLADLVSHVYGPYPDYIFLRDDCPRAGIKLGIRDLELYNDFHRIGFDQSEYIVNPPPGSLLTKSPTVTFVGIVEIQHLDWISDQGQRFLERDFKEYDEKIHMSHTTSSATWSGIQRIYQQLKSEVRVRIACTKNLLAGYLTSDNDYEKLLIYSQHENIRRTYWVQSMNILTYHQSQQFLDRFRLRALIVELCENDPDHAPIEKRNIDFLIERYLVDMRPRDRQGNRRIIASPELEATISYEDRRLRHVSRSELRSRFGAQAEWLLANQLAGNSPNTRLIDIGQWIAFCKETWRDSCAASRHGVKWGLCRRPNSLSKSSSYDLCERLTAFGQTVEFWASKLKIVNQQISRGQNKQAKQLPTSGVDVSERDSHAQAPNYLYDSDFSEATTVDDSESDSQSVIDRRLPHYVYEPPAISSYHTWHCPGCNFSIDLLNVSPDDLTALPAQAAHTIQNTKSWKTSDALIKQAIYTIASKHYETKHVLNDLVFAQHRFTGRKRKSQRMLQRQEGSNVNIKTEYSAQ